MLGRQHFLLSTVTSLVVVSPFIQSHEVLSLASVLGVAIGSLIPDIDAPNATIFHTSVKGLHRSPGKVFNLVIGPIMPLFGYLTKYLVYIPSVEVLNLFTDYSFEEGHRSFTHSLIGVTILTSLTGLLIYPITTEVGLHPFVLYFFLAGYFSGAILHMLQDSFTVSGIAWNQPFSTTKMTGELKTGEDMWKPRYFLFMLIALIPVNLYTVSSIQALEMLFLHGVLISAVAWVFFAWVSGAEITS